MLTTRSFNLDTKPDFPPLPPSLNWVLSPLWGPSRGGAPPYIIKILWATSAWLFLGDV